MRRYLTGVTIALTVFMGVVQFSIYSVAIGWSTRLPGFFLIALLLTVGGILVTAFGLQGKLRDQILAASAGTSGR
jgi:hypothetical protein